MTREQCRNALIDDLGEPFVYSYFDNGGFTDGATPILYPWSFVADGVLKDRAVHTLKRLGVKIGPVIAEHLKPKTRRAA